MIDQYAKNYSHALVWRHSLQEHVTSFSSILQCVSLSLHSLYNASVQHPLRRLYRTGPNLRGIGFWRNASDVDICATLTNVDAQFWRTHRERCAQVIEEDFQSYLVVLETLLYFFIIYSAARHMWGAACFLTRKSLERHGLVERYSPRTLAWLHTRFPSTRRHYASSEENAARRRERIDAGDNDDSPYSAYGTD